jgi:hypothetical protein
MRQELARPWIEVHLVETGTEQPDPEEAIRCLEQADPSTIVAEP